MNITDLIKIELGQTVSVFNEPFLNVGRATLELDSSQSMIWLFGENDQMFSIAKDDEELVLFEQIQDEIEPEPDQILYQGKEYEFSYEDSGKVTMVEGESQTEQEDRFMFSDYEAQGGELLRLISNENTGEHAAYIGRMVSEDDLAEI